MFFYRMSENAMKCLKDIDGVAERIKMSEYTYSAFISYKWDMNSLGNRYITYDILKRKPYQEGY